MNERKNKLFLGTASGEEWGEKRLVNVYATVTLRREERERETVEHERITDVIEVAVTFDIANSRGKSIACGAMGEEGLKAVEAWSVAREVRDALRLLVEWHLNALVAGCAHQEVVWEDSGYGRRPSLDLTQPCERSGYKYGHAWLVRPVTDEVLAAAKRCGVEPPSREGA